MTTRDQIEKLRKLRGAFIVDNGEWIAASLDSFIEHLEEKAKAERLTLEEQAAYVRRHAHSVEREHREQQAAADTLTRLRVEGGKLLKEAAPWVIERNTIASKAVELLKSLGCEPTP